MIETIARHNKHFAQLDVVDKLQLVLSYLLRAVMLGMLVLDIFRGQYLQAFLLLLFFILTFLPSLIERNYKIVFPLEIEMWGIIFLFFSLVLGDLQGVYKQIFWWDLALHLVSGFLLGIIGFFLVYLLIRYSQESKLSISVALVFSLCFANTIGVFWEYVEFVVTWSGLYVMQHGNTDTMTDLIMVGIGSLVAIFFIDLYLKTHKVRFIARIIEKIEAKSKVKHKRLL